MKVGQARGSNSYVKIVGQTHGLNSQVILDKKYGVKNIKCKKISDAENELFMVDLGNQ